MGRRPLLQGWREDFRRAGFEFSAARFVVQVHSGTFAELVEREGIVPAPYVGRYKWVLVEDLEVLSWTELTELLRASYEMVTAKAKIGKAAKKKKSASTMKKRK